MYLGPHAGKWLGSIESTELQIWAGRIMVFVVVLAVGALLEWGFSKIVHLSGLTGTDRALGAFFGVVRSALLVGVFILGGRYAGFDANDWWRESKIIPLGEPVAEWISDMAPRGVEFLQTPAPLPEPFRLQLDGPTG
jgi:membrane protein required for colicin V production